VLSDEPLVRATSIQSAIFAFGTGTFITGEAIYSEVRNQPRHAPADPGPRLCAESAAHPCYHGVASVLPPSARLGAWSIKGNKKGQIMRRKLAAAAGGLALAVALGIPVGTQAAHAVSTTCEPTGSGDGYLQSVGNHEGAGNNGWYATNGQYSDGIHGLFFSPPSDGDAEIYCAVNYGGNEFNIQHPADAGNPPECVSVDTANVLVGWENACGNKWDKWEPTRVGTYQGYPTYILKNVYNGQCLYDGWEQQQAVYTSAGCAASDAFQQFVFPALTLAGA
jgi:hypothetical protein